MIVENKKLPDFLIVGAAKSGSTAIYNYLKDSHDVYLPSIKEPHFFSLFEKNKIKGFDNLPERIKTIDNYYRLFVKAQSHQLIGEASQSYLYNHKATIKAIKKTYGSEYSKVKIIIILRNPIERAWSQYWHFRKNNNESLDFSQAIKSETIKVRLDDNWNIFYDYVGFGMYIDQIKAFKSNFMNVKIYLYDDFKASNYDVLNNISEFLNISSKFYNNSNKIQNISGKRKSNIYGFLWRLNLLTSQFQTIKGLFPKSFRQKARNALMNKSLERQHITTENFDVLKDIYQDEIIELSKFLNNKEILKWLDKKLY